MDDSKQFVSIAEEFLLHVLNANQQPSARELVERCRGKCGAATVDCLVDAIHNLINSKNRTTSAQQAYLKGIIRDDELNRAIAGSDDCREKKEIVTGIDLLVKKSQVYRTSDAFKDMIQFMGMFREYAPYNNMLVRVQNPACGFYATARDWRNRFKRTIKEDARPMLILAPMHPVMLVYDLDSTEGEPLPTSLTDFASFCGEWKDSWLDKLSRNADRHKIRIDYRPLSSTNAGFATYDRHTGAYKMRIAIHDKLDAPSRFGVLCHELAHIFLGHLGGDRDFWWPSRSNLTHHAMEIEAEAVAYIVTSRLELSGASAQYVSGYLKDGSSLPDGVSMDNIGKVSGKILHMVEAMQPEPKERKGRE